MSSNKNSSTTAPEFSAKFNREALTIMVERDSDPEHTAHRAVAYVLAAEKLGVSRWDTMAILINHAQAVAEGFEAERVELIADLFAKVRANPAAVEDDAITQWTAIGARTEEGEVGAAGIVLYAATMEARSTGESSTWDGSGIVEDLVAAAERLAGYEEGEHLAASLAADLPAQKRTDLGAQRAA